MLVWLTKNASIFPEVSFTISAMPKSKTAPVLVIVAAIFVAGGIAVYLSRQGSTAAPSDGKNGAAAAPSVPQQPGGARIRGAADAPVTLVEYGDYQCPTCGHYHPILMELLSRYSGKLKLEYHHYPLIELHQNALKASIAAEAAADQGKFWEMHDLLYEHQKEWAPNPNADAIFLQFALQLGLDSNRFMQSTRSPAARDRVLADVTRGSSIVKGTPTFVINGQLIPELPNLEGLADQVNRQLAALGK